MEYTAAHTLTTDKDMFLLRNITDICKVIWKGCAAPIPIIPNIPVWNAIWKPIGTDLDCSKSFQMTFVWHPISITSIMDQKQLSQFVKLSPSESRASTI